MLEEYDEYDEFDDLREKSARRAAAYEAIDYYDEEETGMFQRFTPMQRLILAIFLVIDVIIIGYVILVLMGRLPSPFG